MKLIKNSLIHILLLFLLLGLIHSRNIIPSIIAFVPNGSATLNFAPGTSTIIPGSTTSLNLQLNTADKNIDSINVYAVFSGNIPSDLVFNPVSISGLRTALNKFDTSGSNKIFKLVINTEDPSIPFTTASTNVSLGTLNFTAPQSGTLNIVFNADNTLVVENSTYADILTTPNNPIYTFQGSISPTPSPTPEPTPTSNPIANLTLNIQYSGYYESGATPYPVITTTNNVLIAQGAKIVYADGANKPLPLQFKNTLGSKTFTNTIDLSSKNLSAGTYDIYIKGPKHLAKMYTKTLTGGDNILDLTTNPLLPGDINNSDNSNTVNSDDYNDLIRAFNDNATTADLNFNGQMDIFDYALLVLNYGKTGDNY